MIIPEGAKHVVIRYANVKGIQCIDEHIKVMHRQGFVWFGKIGIKLKRTFLDDLIEKESNYLILKSPKKTYFCRFEKYQEEVPTDGNYPEYYNGAFGGLNSFTMWFKITKIKEVEDRGILNNIFVISSKNTLIDACRTSMSAHFFTTNSKKLII